MKESAGYQASSAGQQTVESGGTANACRCGSILRSTRTVRLKKAASPGLAFPRFFSAAGVDPFDEVEWELRAAVIGNERGEVVFEQRDVEIRSSGRSRPRILWCRSTSAGRLARPSVAQRQAAHWSCVWIRSRPGAARIDTSPATRICRRSATIQACSRLPERRPLTARSGSTAGSKRPRSALPASSIRSKTRWTRS